MEIQQQLLSVDQTALILGLSEKCIWNWIHCGKIASVRVIGTRRIERSTVEQLIDDGRSCAGVLPKLTLRGSGVHKPPTKLKGAKNKTRPLPVITPVQTPVPDKKDWVMVNGWLVSPEAAKLSTKK